MRHRTSSWPPPTLLLHWRSAVAEYMVMHDALVCGPDQVSVAVIVSIALYRIHVHVCLQFATC